MLFPVDLMSSRTLNITDAVAAYLQKASSESDVLARLRRETARLPEAGMQISPEQGRLLTFLIELISAKRAIEIGVFTGYSAISVAQALPDDGKLIACDVSEEWTQIARRYWQEAGVAHKIELRLAPALTTLRELVAQNPQSQTADDERVQREPFDFAFIDADKQNIGAYYEACLALLRAGGLIAVDNALWGGRVTDTNTTDLSTKAIATLNERVIRDDRVSASLIPIGDGLLLARKR
jgi:caffeoyl-CoA O-methyltransferase